MKFSLSTNISNIQLEDFTYIVTSNAQRVFDTMLNDFNTGIHNFILVGTYGTGKSSFLAAFESDLLNKTNYFFSNKGQFNKYNKFVCKNFVADYCSLHQLLSEDLIGDNSYKSIFFDELEKQILSHKKAKEFLVFVIDEFGKTLEHAANHNPDKELYFLQQLAEFLNNPKHDNVLLITTLHQNFGSYSKNLKAQQRNEWEKVKGRFKEIVFAEPIEQLLYLAANKINHSFKEISSINHFNSLFNLAINSKFVSSNFDIKIAKKIYPLDLISAVVLTKSIQRYGQNERSLFTFLYSKSHDSINNFTPKLNLTYNLAYVYDYIQYNFYSYLSEVNNDSSNWRAIKVALERVENNLNDDNISDALIIVKSIGLLNVFANSLQFNNELLLEYLKLSSNIKNPETIIDLLINFKIIRYAKYKSQYIIYEGTDINIEDELYKASEQIPRPIDIIDDLNQYFEFKITQANAYYYETGTPRFFEYQISSFAKDLKPENDIDGYINLVFSNNNKEKKNLIEVSKECRNAVIYVFFNNVSKIIDHLYEIQKLDYIRTKIIVDDKIADLEIQNLIIYEKDALNKAINHSLTSFSSTVEWYYKGEKNKINSQSDFNKLLSKVCFDVYPSTPHIHNELINKQKVNSVISQSRNNLLALLIDDTLVIQEDLGIQKDKFPPEKTIYYSLLKNTGIHRKIDNIYTLYEPDNEAINDLWKACEEFFKSTIDKQRKLGELINVLKNPPFKIKQGLLDFWIPIFLIIKKQDYSLYDSSDRYIPNLNKEVMELIQRNPNEFKIKAFAIDGVKLQFFNQYRAFFNLNDREFIKKDSFIETIKPFLVFYNNLNEYTKSTKNFDDPITIKFRDTLASARDPEQTFFNDLPLLFGFKNETLIQNEEFMSQYQDLIKKTIRELRLCYQNLINKIEDNLIDELGIKTINFLEYKPIIEDRFKNLKVNLLSKKQKSFLNRLLMHQEDKTLWYESICYILLDKSLESIKDNEINNLIESLRYNLLTLTKYIEITNIAKKNIKSEIYKFEMVSSNGTIKPKSFILPENQISKTNELEDKINMILSGDKNLDVCLLLRILKSKIDND